MTPQHSPARDIALTAVFAAFIAVLGLVPTFSPFGFAVPITLQSLGVMLAGAVLGPRRGCAAVAFFVALVAIGFPLLAGGVGGLGMFATPRGGYIIGFPIAAAVVGAIVYRRGAPFRIPSGFVAIVTGGIIVLYAIGIPFSAWRAGIGLGAAIVASATFLIGDLLKAVVATVVADAVHRARPDLLPRRRAEAPAEPEPASSRP